MIKNKRIRVIATITNYHVDIFNNIDFILFKLVFKNRNPHAEDVYLRWDIGYYYVHDFLQREIINLLERNSLLFAKEEETPNQAPSNPFYIMEKDIYKKFIPELLYGVEDALELIFVPGVTTNTYYPDKILLTTETVESIVKKT